MPRSEPGKILIVYFSWSGHTQTVANVIHELVGCDMVEIEPEEPYSDEYNEVVDRFKSKKNDHILPTLRARVENMGGYDTLIIGSPIWDGLLSSSVEGFLSGYDLPEKKILPFCTRGGSGTTQSMDDICKLYPHAEILLFMAVKLQTLGMK